MKNKVVEKVIVFALLSVMTITLLGLCACQKDADTQPSGNEPYKIEYPQHETLKSSLIKVYTARVNEYTYNKYEIITSYEDMKNFNIDEPYYTEAYFENNVILLINFQYSSSVTKIEYKGLAIIEDKFYPIVESDQPQVQCADVNHILFMVECNRDILGYKFGGIIEGNRLDAWDKSYYIS